MKEQNEVSIIDYLRPFTTKKAIYILITIGIVTYINTLFNDFVWDDFYQIVNNPYVHSLENIPKFFLGSTFFVENTHSLQGLYYKPLLSVLYALIYVFSGGTAFGYHLFQVTFHILNSVLLLLILKRHFNIKISFFSSLLFLVHPINSEVVSYIADLQDVMFLFFGILSIYLIESKFNELLKKITIFLLLLASVLTKETGILFFILILYYAIIFIKKEKLIYTLLIILNFILYLILRINTVGLHSEAETISPISTASIYERLTTIPAIIYYYLKTFLFPFDLSISQQWVTRHLDFSSFYFPLIVVLFVFCLIFYYGYSLYKSKNKDLKYYLFFVVWFILGLSVHLQFYPLDFTVATRWFYFPLIGLIGIIFIFYKNLESNSIKNGFNIFLILIIIIFSTRTIVRNTDWHDSLTLFQRDEKINKSFDLENLLGVELFKVGRTDEAIYHFQYSIQLKPEWSNSWNNLGFMYMQKLDIKNAKDAFRQAIRISLKEGHPDMLAYKNLGQILLYNEKNYNETSELLNSAVEYFPNDKKLLQMKTLADYKAGDKKKGIRIGKKVDPTRSNG